MKMLTLALLLISFSGLSQARSEDHNRHNDRSRYSNGYFWQNVERRQHNQYSRVNHGVERGQLTRREIKQLKRERKHLTKSIRRNRRHNNLSHSNKRNILRRLDHYSDQIYNLKQNNYYARSHRQQYARHGNYRYPKHNNRYSEHGRLSYSSRNNHKYYRNNGFLSHSNNNFSSGFYFRF